MVVWSTKISFFEWFQMYLWFYSTESTRRRNRTAMTRMKILYTDRYMIRAYIINQLKNHCIFIFTIQFVYWHHQWYLLTTLLQLFLWSSWQVYNEIFLFFNISFQRLTFCPSWFICNFVPGFFFHINNKLYPRWDSNSYAFWTEHFECSGSTIPPLG